MNDILDARIRLHPPQSLQDCCVLAAQLSIAVLGPVYGDDEIKWAAKGLAAGLFGEAFNAADVDHQSAWIAICEAEYRRALHPSS